MLISFWFSTHSKLKIKEVKVLYSYILFITVKKNIFVGFTGIKSTKIVHLFRAKIIVERKNHNYTNDFF